ncbi:MAG: hypothetical protein Q9M26_01655 [Mariprofundales bacterium]|nr:hypothetical protein [Mariprofundales bacterium]
MKRIAVVSFILALLPATPAWALDSYRYLHVTIKTPEIIFVFLFFLVMAPLIVLMILYWYTAMQKDDQDDSDE